MTGFGSAQRETERYSATAEIRSLNSKTLDLSLRLPRFLQEHELEIRNLVARQLVRGKVNLNFDVVRTRATSAQGAVVNKAALQLAWQELTDLNTTLGLSTDQLLALARTVPGALRLPADASSPQDDDEPIAWDELRPILMEALERAQQFRRDEGQALSAEIVGYTDKIRILLADVDKHDPTRIEAVRQRLQTQMAEVTSSEHFNPVRFEQEILHYIEKLDIAEEKVRLLNHLHYFNETIFLAEPVGKKLAFIAQEMGREINTIGSKANDSTIQHLVVEMKEELEKIKEQINNIL